MHSEILKPVVMLIGWTLVMPMTRLPSLHAVIAVFHPHG